MTDEENSQEIAKQLAGRIINGRKILRACGKEIEENLRVRGKTLGEWAKELRVEVTEVDDDLSGLERACTLIGSKIQEAEGLLGYYEAIATATGNFHENAFAQRYVAEMQVNKKMAADKIKQLVLVNESIDSSLSATQTASLVADYFKRIVKGLEEARKGLENRIRILHIRLRLEGGRTNYM